jgi:murein DD-endopeptidase MepM/ murein hydrolase activator NlpD
VKPTSTTVRSTGTSTTVTTTNAATTTSTTIDPALIALSQSVTRTRPSNDAGLLSALAPLQRLGYTAQQADIFGMGQFPVAGPAFYSDDWLQLRVGPPAKLHYGIDVVAAMGTPLRSPIDGILRYDTSDPTGYGLAAIVTGPDRTYYLMGHLSAEVAGLASGTAVKHGQVVGFVGSTGDSTGPHCHFEVHPGGGAGIDAKPILDRWLADAVAAVPALIRSVQAALVTTTAVPLPAPLPLEFSAPPAHVGGVLARADPRRPTSASLAGPGAAAVIALLIAGALATKRVQPSDQES